MWSLPWGRRDCNLFQGPGHLSPTSRPTLLSGRDRSLYWGLPLVSGQREAEASKVFSSSNLTHHTRALSMYGVLGT